MVANTKVSSNQTKIANSKTTTTTIVADKCSLWLVIITGITVVMVVITGICVKFLLETYISSIILMSLICFEIILALVVLSLLAWRKKKIATNRTFETTRRNGQYQSIQPSAPQEESSWEYSNRETLPA